MKSETRNGGRQSVSFFGLRISPQALPAHQEFTP